LWVESTHTLKFSPNSHFQPRRFGRYIVED
jgi:hypothetical protein